MPGLISLRYHLLFYRNFHYKFMIIILLIDYSN